MCKCATRSLLVNGTNCTSQSRVCSSQILTAELKRSDSNVNKQAQVIAKCIRGGSVLIRLIANCLQSVTIQQPPVQMCSNTLFMAPMASSSKDKTGNAKGELRRGKLLFNFTET